MDARHIAEQVFLAGIDSVLPDRLIMKWMEIRDPILYIGDLHFDLNKIENIYVIGAGKASALMGEAVEKILGTRITEGHIVVKYGHSRKLSHIKVTEAGHPVPDNHGLWSTSEILKIAEKAKDKDLVLCLISGGGSALLTDFPEGSSLKDIMIINDLLVRSGACISEINAVRKHLSGVKGGRLAQSIAPATLVTLILSDVPGDSPDVIASGPTVPDPTTYKNAWDVLTKFNLLKLVPQSLSEHIMRGIDGTYDETPKSGNPIFEKTYNLLIGTNRIALEAAKIRALDFNINAIIINDKVQGDISSIAEYLIETALQFQSDPTEVKPVALLFGGEATVTMSGKGKGGRNQHLAMLCAGILKDHAGITLLSAGTDGNDGPTDAAGAVVDSVTIPSALAKNIDPEGYISDFDSFHFFKKAGGHIITGPTMTNVMDIIVVIVEA
jgi:glycerate-2-kinase